MIILLLSSLFSAIGSAYLFYKYKDERLATGLLLALSIIHFIFCLAVIVS